MLAPTGEHEALKMDGSCGEWLSLKEVSSENTTVMHTTHAYFFRLFTRFNRCTVKVAVMPL